MKNKFTLLLIFCMLFTFSSTAQVDFNIQLIVYFKTGVKRVPPGNTTATITSGTISNLLNSYGIPSSNVVPSFPSFNESDTVNTETGEISRQMNLAKIFTITITNPATKQNLLNELNTNSEVLYAESNGDATTNLIPADGRFNQQWGLRNLVVPDADIHAEAAWDIFTGNPNAIIAIIDNGVDRNHNDLDTKILGGDVGFVIEEDNLLREFSHGSHVAGIAAAISNNTGNNGVAGVDWLARIHPKNIFDGNGDPDITQSIIDAVNFNKNVWTLNNSWGLTNGRDGSGNGIPGRYSTTVRSAFAQAYRNNRVQCVAMGNHQNYSGGIYANVVAYPAGFNSGIIAVGATDDQDHISNFSANGTHIDVSAPGVSIWSTNFNNGYFNLSGTSMATPHVAGLASLLKGFNTDLANDDIEQIIRLTTDDVNSVTNPGFDNQLGTGRINAQSALQSLQAPNQLFQLSTTGGTVFSTAGNQQKVFLGVPGLSDAAYIVKRSEVRTNVTFPNEMCSMFGAWGRGVGTTGYREEQGRCFGEGICEIVPGTLTNSSATLRTWIYEVWSVTGQYLGFYPNSAGNVVFQYTILGVPTPTSIVGNTLICNSSDYSIENLPQGSIVTWSKPGGGPVLELFLNTPNSNELRIVNHKWYQSATTLFASVANPACSTITLSKFIKNDNSTSSVQPFSYYQEACSNPSQSGTAYSGANPTFVHRGCMVYVNLGDMTGKTVSFGTAVPPLLWGVGSTSYYQNTLYFKLPLNSGGIPFRFDITGDGTCYTNSLLFFSYSNNMNYTFKIAPNPVKNDLIVTAKENEDYLKERKLKSGKKQSVFSMQIYEVNTKAVVYSKKGTNSSLKWNIHTSHLKRGYYVLRIDDGESKYSIKFFKE